MKTTMIAVSLLVLGTYALADEVTYPKMNQLKCVGSIEVTDSVTRETVTTSVDLHPTDFGSPGWYEGTLGNVDFEVAFEMRHMLLGSIVVSNPDDAEATIKIAGVMNVPVTVDGIDMPSYISGKIRNTRYALDCKNKESTE